MNDLENFPAYRLASIPPAPDTLSHGARQEWVTLAKQIYQLQTGRPADLRSLELLCEVLAEISVLQETINSEGYTVEAGSGGRKGHPALTSLERARRHAQNLLDKFGLVPGSKAKRAPKFDSERYHKHLYGR